VWLWSGSKLDDRALLPQTGPQCVICVESGRPPRITLPPRSPRSCFGSPNECRLVNRLLRSCPLVFFRTQPFLSTAKTGTRFLIIPLPPYSSLMSPSSHQTAKPILHFLYPLPRNCPPRGAHQPPLQPPHRRTPNYERGPMPGPSPKPPASHAQTGPMQSSLNQFSNFGLTNRTDARCGVIQPRFFLSGVIHQT